MKNVRLKLAISVGLLTFAMIPNNTSALEYIDKYTCLPIYYDVNETANTNNKIAYITIDDGPSKYTKDILQILKKHDAHATFFMIDMNMKVNKDAVIEIVESGNSAGFHSVSHDVNKLYENYDSAKREFDKNKETFYEITGRTSNIIRLPYGSKPYTPVKSYENLVDAGYKLWDWNIDTQDWKNDSNKIIEIVKEQVKNKKEVVILMHEKKQTVQALDEVLTYLNEEGYEILPINEKQIPKNFWNINTK
ncbi:polysaccharide deacetylase family protein [Romboutsia sp. 1001216sp1]|uniref:polysaccharide deacetylase family protein n=1 Tax=Romboutsia sp. 1001216sp1 TaxID=2986997 RepID=UPI00232E384C|nr:polysaccharide deacetylase family protein [Romboutsia sp. 1001216sp1]MDB8804885.1 polysaccharide deacetylase [Romboutsia sp. 1001216sp1]MDB8809042.1 polysaccharide deacetylase [Romboutsia sp. 1001216sp1]MDB8810531.1 polysaccharide deacetylase [Romboutsia sp. 1001216sp1]MDB8816250.1 polysaccharide deacetylase [Romboutsia sp. 1001216sp1]MDB8818796.1 polysaccharide deacetylase [Romboutsia sp. 1001216sp1]